MGPKNNTGRSVAHDPVLFYVQHFHELPVQRQAFSVWQNKPKTGIGFDARQVARL
jgi:hypothetical protein